MTDKLGKTLMVRYKNRTFFFLGKSTLNETIFIGNEDGSKKLNVHPNETEFTWEKPNT